jgi:hypothetical protein
MFDFENDGDQDMAMTGGYHVPWTDASYSVDLCTQLNVPCVGLAINRITLFQNVNSSVASTWPEVAYETGLSYRNYNVREDSRALAPIDFDNDGDLDILEVVIERGLVLHEHITPSKNRWLKISLKGSISNSFGIGAEITVFNVDTGKQFFAMSSPQSYVNSRSYIAFFGFGPTSSPAYVSVYWPVSKRRIDYELQLNQHVTLFEDDSCTTVSCTLYALQLFVLIAAVERLAAIVSAGA